MSIENFTWFIPDRIAASGLPHSDDHFDWLWGQGIRAIVSLTERSLQQERSVQHKVQRFVYRHIPVREETAPTHTQIDAFLQFLKDQDECGEPVLVLSAGGCGCTGAMLACYLVSQGWPAEDAIQQVRCQRPGSIAVQAQAECVREYAATMYLPQKECQESMTR